MEEEEVDEEEESSDASPLPKAVVKQQAAVAVPTKVATTKMTVPPVVVAAPIPAVVAAPVVAKNDDKHAELNTTIDSMLNNPQEMEHFLSFVESSDKKAAQRTGANLVFLQKVSQFNKADPAERPKVLH